MEKKRQPSQEEFYIMSHSFVEQDRVMEDYTRLWGFVVGISN